MGEFSQPESPPMGECQVWGRGIVDSALLFTPNSQCFLRPPGGPHFAVFSETLLVSNI